MIGDVIESAIWLSGEETPEQRAMFEKDVTDAIGYFCSENHYAHGPVTFTEKHPMDDDVPEVPDHIQGQRVRLLVAAADIEQAVKTSIGSFVAQLEHKDLMKLRGVIRKYGSMSNEDCDEIIEELGPDSALDTLKTIH